MRMMNDRWQRTRTQEAADDFNVEEDVFVEDSWFGFIPTAVSLNENMPNVKRSGCIVNIKTAHVRYSKAFLERKMDN